MDTRGSFSGAIPPLPNTP